MSNEITTPYDRVLIDPNEPLILPDGTAITGRLETFLYALCCLDYDNLPTPLSRIEEFANALITGEIPNIEPQSRSEQFFLAILDGNIDNLPEPQSRSEVLLNKLAVGDFDLTNVDPIQSRYELLLAYLIKNGGVGNLDYVLYEFYQATQTLYNTQEKPVKSAILKGNTKYRDIDTGDILDTFDETKNLELVSVKVPALTTTGKNLFDGKLETGLLIDSTGQPNTSKQHKYTPSFIKIDASKKYCLHAEADSFIGVVNVYYYDDNKNYLGFGKDIITGINTNISKLFTPHYSDASYVRFRFFKPDNVELSIDAKNIAFYESSTIIDMYEPYKSNILSTPSDLELRGIGEIQDELDCLTGEVTQRIGEVVLDGSEYWDYINETFRIGIIRDKVFGQVTATDRSKIYLMCDKCESRAYMDSWDSGKFISLHISKDIVFRDENFTNIQDWKQYLSQNPITVQYQLATVSVKTVDLSVIDQDGNVLPKIKTFNDITHVNVSSNGILPKVEMEVATYNEEDIANANVMTASMDEIYSVQNELDNTNSIQSEEIDSTMIASTEIYENIL